MKIRKYILVPVVGFLASLLISCDVSDNPVEPVEPVVNISSLGIKADGLVNGKMTLVVSESVRSTVVRHLSCKRIRRKSDVEIER